MKATGYVVLEAVVNAETLADLGSCVDDLLATHGPNVEVSAGTQWIRELTGISSAIDKIADDARVSEAVTELLGDTFTLDSIRMRNPVGPTAQQSLHVDASAPVPPGADQLAQVLLFLDDVTLNNGATQLVPGSHRFYAVPGREYADPRREHPAEIAITCNAGDALVFSSHLWHRGTANSSGRPRRTITYAFRTR